ncbi:hypothetical protein Tco_0886492 [Tanacetum coccineum]
MNHKIEHCQVGIGSLWDGVEGESDGFVYGVQGLSTSLPVLQKNQVTSPLFIDLGEKEPSTSWEARHQDPCSRLDQHPTERGQSLEATGWETKRTLGLFLSSSRPRSGSNIKSGINILDHKPLTPSSLGLRELGKGSSNGKPLVTKLQ